MAKNSERKGAAGKPAPEIEIEPDSCNRFERAVDIVAKSPPQHRTAKAKGGKPESKPPKAKD